MEQAKLLSMTALLTLLIWVSADSLVNETAIVECRLQVQPAAEGSNMLLSLDEDQGTFEIEISGPRKTVEQISDQAPLSVRLSLEDRPTGVSQIHLDRTLGRSGLIEQFPEFRKLTLIAFRPNQIAVSVDYLVRRDVEVTLSRTTLAYEVPPQQEPSTVSLYIRRSVLQQFERDALPIAIDPSAEVDSRFRMQKPGQAVTLRVPIDVSDFGPDAYAEPKLIEVTATLGAEVTTAEIPAVPILFAASSENLQRAVRPVLADGSPIGLLALPIRVRGPTEEVQKLLRGETQAFGIIRLKADDFDDLNATKIVNPIYHLPDRLVQVEPRELVEFRLVPVTQNRDSE